MINNHTLIVQVDIKLISQPSSKEISIGYLDGYYSIPIFLTHLKRPMKWVIGTKQGNLWVWFGSSEQIWDFKERHVMFPLGCLEFMKEAKSRREASWFNFPMIHTGSSQLTTYLKKRTSDPDLKLWLWQPACSHVTTIWVLSNKASLRAICSIPQSCDWVLWWLGES